MFLLSLIFVQDLLKLSSSLKVSLIRVNCHEMGSFENNKCGHLIYLTTRDTEPENYALSEKQTPVRPQPQQTITKPQKRQKLQILTTENRLPITALFPNFSDFIQTVDEVITSAPPSATSQCISVHFAFWFSARPLASKTFLPGEGAIKPVVARWTTSDDYIFPGVEQQRFSIMKFHFTNSKLTEKHFYAKNE